MGAVTFSIDPTLVNAIQSALPIRVFIETGTFKGDTVAAIESRFEKIISIELSEILWKTASSRFKTNTNIQIIHGHSEAILAGLNSYLQKKSVLYWLDAHWCVASNTAGELSQCPLLEELQSIGELNTDSIILIDDARLFLAPPPAPHEISQWPSFHQIASCLMSMSHHHELMVINDVIAFFPSHARKMMQTYAQSHGIDWLNASNSIKEKFNILNQLHENISIVQKKEKELQGLHARLDEKEKELQGLHTRLDEKEHILQNQAKTILAYRLAYGRSPFFFLPPLARIIRRTREIIRPRLGNLNQYAPRPLTISLQKPRANPGGYPCISMITPSFDQGAFIERTILSVLDQQYPNFEYFVQDGGSRDCTIEILEKYASKLSGWVSEKDNGQSHAINRAFAQTSGEIMAWLNSDDLLLPGALATVADYFNRHPDVDVVYGNRLLINENDMEIGRWIMPGHDDAILSWVDYVPQETMFWRRRIWEKVGGQIDESFRFAMDWDLLVRFRDAGAKFAHIPQFMGAFRIHEHQKTSATINEIGHKEMDLIRERLLGRVPSYKEIRNTAFSYLLKHIAFDIAYRVKKNWKFIDHIE